MDLDDGHETGGVARVVADLQFMHGCAGVAGYRAQKVVSKQPQPLMAQVPTTAPSRSLDEQRIAESEPIVVANGASEFSPGMWRVAPSPPTGSQAAPGGM